MKKKSIIQKIFRTKYFWISLFFFIWMSFFDTNSLILHWKLKKTINKMILDRNFLKKKIFLEGNHLKKLNKDPKYLEKIAREKFYMKKEDEDLFVLSKAKN
ncbi:septum formation initiator family protein [Blattabacterium sp. (Cryptocercus kyebangensis)]|uniref:FtsB family cell division protein n=1 Tax=Blattabacterium sp. (Cryptocercus kyebangensis) TaxID=298656 RepID=UPI000D7BB027|nr:septum formation initiator family protein [Blattabacterium sp. (Cryptocercus kyebangensis)]AWU44040.1 septum formation initiator family protein [Blattabacterium sp. (Cryptocercus kyebangensis)]